MKKAIIVGSGFGGIASALRLKALGYDVCIYDLKDQFEYELNNYIVYHTHPQNHICIYCYKGG